MNIKINRIFLNAIWMFLSMILISIIIALCATLLPEPANVVISLGVVAGAFLGGFYLADKYDKEDT